MNRREMIKTAAGAGVVALIPTALATTAVANSADPTDKLAHNQWWEICDEKQWEEFVPRDKAIEVFEGEYMQPHWAWGRCKFSQKVIQRRDNGKPVFTPKCVKSVEFKTPVYDLEPLYKKPLEYFLGNSEWKVQMSSGGFNSDDVSKKIELQLINRHTLQKAYVCVEYNRRQKLLKGTYWAADWYLFKRTWFTGGHEAKEGFKKFEKLADLALIPPVRCV